MSFDNAVDHFQIEPHCIQQRIENDVVEDNTFLHGLTARWQFSLIF